MLRCSVWLGTVCLWLSVHSPAVVLGLTSTLGTGGVSWWSRLVPVWGDAASAEPVSTAGRDRILQDVLTPNTAGGLLLHRDMTPLPLSVNTFLYNYNDLMIVVKNIQIWSTLLRSSDAHREKSKCRYFSSWIQHLVCHENDVWRLSLRTKRVSIRNSCLSQRLFSAIIQNPSQKSDRLFVEGARAMLTSGLAYKHTSWFHHLFHPAEIC